VFPCVACTHEYRKDAPWRFGLSSLQNFAADLQAGVPYLIGHNTDERNGGYSYSGYYDAEQKEVRAAVYLVRDFPLTAEETTETEIEAIQKGLRRAVSVGPAGMGRWICDLCKEDVFGGICPHFPGASYEGRACTATIEDLRLVELSGAFMGAVPGTDILRAKAQRMKRQGALSASALDWLNRTQAADVPSAILPASLPSTTPARSGKEQRPMKEFFANLSARLLQRGKLQMAATVIGADENNLEKLADDLSAQVDTEVQSALAANPLLSALAAAEIKTLDALATLIKQAKEGREASAEMNKALEEAAVRRFGQGDWKAYVQAYQHLPLAQRKEVAAQWEKDADEKFGTAPNAAATRQTAPTALPNVAIDAEQPLDEASEARVQKMLAATPLGQQAIKNGKE
jgi:hypothetical protein